MDPAEHQHPDGELTTPRPLVMLWIIAALCLLAGDAALFLSARTVRNSLAWLEPRVTRPVPDSLRQRVSRFLRDSIGVTTERHEDTLVLTVLPGARRAIDDQVYLAQGTAARAGGWIVAALILFHVPLLIAIGVTIAWLRGRATDERNRALREWTEDA